MKQISLRQICLLFIAFVPVTKVIFMRLPTGVISSSSALRPPSFSMTAPT